MQEDFTSVLGAAQIGKSWDRARGPNLDLDLILHAHVDLRHCAETDELKALLGPTLIHFSSCTSLLFTIYASGGSYT